MKVLYLIFATNYLEVAVVAPVSVPRISNQPIGDVVLNSPAKHLISKLVRYVSR